MNMRQKGKHNKNDIMIGVTSIVATAIYLLDGGCDDITWEGKLLEYQEIFYSSLLSEDQQQLDEIIQQLDKIMCFAYRQTIRDYGEGRWDKYTIPPNKIKWMVYRKVRRNRPITIGEIKDVLPGWRERALVFLAGAEERKRKDEEDIRELFDRIITDRLDYLIDDIEPNDGNIPFVKSTSVYSLTRIEDSLSIKYIVTCYYV
jgi:hypothetical protein